MYFFIYINSVKFLLFLKVNEIMRGLDVEDNRKNCFSVDSGRSQVIITFYLSFSILCNFMPYNFFYFQIYFGFLE